MKAYYVTHDPYEEDFSYVIVVNGNHHMRIGAFDDHVEGIELCLEAFGYEEKWVDEMRGHHNVICFIFPNLGIQDINERLYCSQ